MRKNKVGSIFLVSMLALAGLGMSYAGFTDAISVYGTVDTATVDIDWIGWYSGTWVWKVWGTGQPDGEIYKFSGWVANKPTDAQVQDMFPGCQVEFVSESYAAAGTDYDVIMTYDNLFPCIDFEADFIFHYGGSIPAKINVAEIFPLTEDPYDETAVGFLTWLWNYHLNNPGYGAWVEAYRAYPIYNGVNEIIGWNINEEEPVDVGTQLHFCDYVYVKLVIHLPQDNLLQGLTGTFDGTIGVIQWYDPCPE